MNAVLAGVVLAALYLRWVAAGSLAIEETHEVGRDGDIDRLIIVACDVVVGLGLLAVLAQVARPLLDQLVGAWRRRREAEWREDWSA